MQRICQHRLAGHVVEALDVVEEAITSFAAWRDLLCAPELWLLKGEALAALGAGAEQVEACQRAALALARELGALSSELRAAMHLARLLHRQGRLVEGRQVLQGVFARFSEGFDTSELLAARDLLGELGES